MKAAVLHEVGTPLSVDDVPEPAAGEGQSVIDVKAAGINFADVLIRNGQYPPIADVTRDLVPEDRRQLRRLGIHAVLDQDVGEVDSRRLDLEEGLSFAGLRLRHVLDREGTTGLVQDRGLHCISFIGL